MVFNACKIRCLVSVVFCVVTAVLKLGLRLVINETFDKQRPVGRTSRSDKTLTFDKNYVFPTTVVAHVKGLYPICAGHVHSLE